MKPSLINCPVGISSPITVAVYDDDVVSLTLIRTLIMRIVQHLDSGPVVAANWLTEKRSPVLKLILLHSYSATLSTNTSTLTTPAPAPSSHSQDQAPGSSSQAKIFFIYHSFLHYYKVELSISISNTDQSVPQGYFTPTSKLTSELYIVSYFLTS